MKKWAIIGTVILGIMTGVLIKFSAHHQSYGEPKWAENAVSSWAVQMRLEPTATRCSTWNSHYAQCDAVVNGTIYSLDCYDNSGCMVERK